jgi:WD40 repeat protein
MAQQHEAAGQVERAQELLLEAAPESPDARRRDFAWRREWHESRQHLAFVWQHPSALVGMAISLDGRALVSSDRSGHVYAGSPRQEAPDWTIKTATEGMALLAFDSAARLLLACGNRGAGQRQEIQLLDAATGRLRSRIEGLEDRHVQSMTFLPDGVGLAFSTTTPTGADADIRFYDLRLDRAEPSHRARIETATTTVLPRRGSLVAVIGRHDSLGVVDLATGELVWSVERKCPVEAAATTVDGRYLAACRGGEVFVWNWENECPVVSRTLPGAITGISFLPDRKTLCVQTAEGTIVLIDVISGSERLIRPDTMDRARRVIAAVSDNGAMIATNSYGHPGGSSPLTLWDARTGSRIAECIGRGGMPDCLEFAPDGRTLYIGRDRWVGRWNLDATPQPAPITAHTDEAWSAEFSYNGLNLVTSSDDTDDRQTLKLWTVDPASRVAPLTLRLGWHAHNATVSDTAFSPDGKAVATVSLEPTHSVMLWDAASGRLLDELLGHTDWVRSVAFSPNGKWLATAGCDRTVRIWDVAARACVHILTGHTNKIRSVAFSRDGAQLTSAGNDGFIHTWDVETGSLLRSLDARENIVDVKYSNDGSTIAAAGASGYVWLIDATDGKTPRRVPADVDELICLTFSSSGEVLATAGISGTIHLLDPRTGQELLTLKGHKAQVNALAFNPDDTMLVSCDHAGQLRVWRADP